MANNSKILPDEEEPKGNEAQKPSEPPKSKEVDPSVTPGSYAIVTEGSGQRRVFAVFNGTVKILPVSALGGAFELK